MSYVLDAMMCIPTEVRPPPRPARLEGLPVCCSPCADTHLRGVLSIVQGENFCPPAFDRSWLKKGPYYSNGHTFCDTVLADADVAAAVERGAGSVRKEYRITNVDRSAFTRVSGALAKKWGNKGFQGRLTFDLTGAAGQSFCAFLSQGIDVKLNGYANDYVAKGMNGGKVVVTPPKSDDEASKSAGRGNDASGGSVVGNTVLYGATGGSLLVRGRGGERFAVRNSGATGVVEGLGDHGCEYMTGGVVVCLGNTGRNFGAGMTGGLAFVLDDEAWLDNKAGAGPAEAAADSNIFAGLLKQVNVAFDKASGSGADKPGAPVFADFVNPETITLQKLSPRCGMPSLSHPACLLCPTAGMHPGCPRFITLVNTLYSFTHSLTHALSLSLSLSLSLTHTHTLSHFSLSLSQLCEREEVPHGAADGARRGDRQRPRGPRAGEH